MSEADNVTPAEVTGLNEAVVARGANLARPISAGLFLVAGLGVLAWAWITLRSLGLFGDSFDRFEDEPDVDLGYRLDAAATYVFVLVISALAAGLGVALRLMADYTVARTGGSLTGVRAGESLAAADPRPPAVAEGDGDANAGEPEV